MNKKVVILALDNLALDEALSISEQVKDKLLTVKVGLELYNLAHRTGIKKFNDIGLNNLMLDLKLQDIPTVFKKDNLSFGQKDFTTKQGNRGRYIGQMNKDKKAHGIGVRFYDTGDIQEGYFENSDLNGFARRFYSDGRCYIGMYKNHEKVGEGQYFSLGADSPTPGEGIWQDNEIISH